jgi:hypothetical protein
MVQFDCRHCGTTLVAVASTEHDPRRTADTERMTNSPYPALFLTCPKCGSAWEQDPNGALLQIREPVEAQPANPG